MAGKTTLLVHSTHVADHLEHSSDLLMLDEQSYLSAKLTVEIYLFWAFLGALRRLGLCSGDEGRRKRM